MEVCRRILILMSYKCVSSTAEIEMAHEYRTSFEEPLVAWSGIAACCDSSKELASYDRQTNMMGKKKTYLFHISNQPVEARQLLRPSDMHKGQVGPQLWSMNG